MDAPANSELNELN